MTVKIILHRVLGILLVCMLIGVSPTHGGPLFDETEPLQLTLTGPFKAMFRNADGKMEYPGQLSFAGDSGDVVTVDVQIRTRGISRRHKNVCRFPPLKIRFDKTQTKDTVFRGQESIKLVTHCNPGGRYQQYYAKEYLVYRTYNLLTPLSFQVRRATMNYHYNDSKKQVLENFGFFIEDVDDVAKRNDLKEIVIGDINKGRLDPKTADRYALFQHMMGNLDWSFLSGPDPNECCHNTKLLGKREPGELLYPVPYDFDASGMVDTHYSIPPENLNVTRVTQRLYRGFCTHQEHLPEHLAQFRDLREEIYATMVEDPLLIKNTQAKTRRYMDAFYAIIDDPKQLAKKIEGKCRG